MHSDHYLKEVIVGGLLLLLLAAWAAPAHGQAHHDPELNAVFKKLVRERQKLAWQRTDLDRRIAQAIKQGEEPVVLMAKQVAAQDQLDLTELRLEVMATRLQREVPPLQPMQGASIRDHQEKQVRARALMALGRGKASAMRQIEREAKALLASIDFNAFLGPPPRRDGT